MRIAFGCDHAGLEGGGPTYKDTILKHLRSAGHNVIDCGAHTPESVDYPDYADRVCREILAGRADTGVLLCGAGLGMSMAANRHRGIRAAVVVNAQMARLAREHNNANIICLGRRTTSVDDCLALTDLFLATAFDGGERHTRRVEKIDAVGGDSPCTT
jgi:ribose 5-phosphate isomerase B